MLDYYSQVSNIIAKYMLMLINQSKIVVSNTLGYLRHEIYFHCKSVVCQK